jgi:hypothetical protein
MALAQALLCRHYVYLVEKPGETLNVAFRLAKVQFDQSA